MKQNSNKRVQQLINGLLIVIVVIVAGWLSTQYKFESDWTYGNSNTLTASSQKLMQTLEDPITMLVFDYPSSANRQTATAWAARYQRFKADFKLAFVDPSAQPARAKEFNIGSAGEVVLEYQGRHENLQQLSEQAITGALQRLTDSGEYNVLFLDGHGERNMLAGPGTTQNDMALFAEALTGKGLKVQPLNLVKTPSVPDNTSVLVIASPTQTLLEGEVKLINDYLDRGGNLLWLTDPDAPDIEAVAKKLGIHWQNGAVIFPNYALLGSPSPAVYFATDYPPNPITRDFRDATAFPLVRSVTSGADAQAAGWTAQPLVQTDAQSWLETGKLDGPVELDTKAGDVAGPLTLGLSLTRPRKSEDGKPASMQRVVVFGDSDFLADANLNVLGNRQLGLNIVQWLAERDNQLNIDVPKAPDTVLRLPGWAFWVIGVGYTALLPLLLLVFGVLRWHVRRRQ